MAKKNGGSAEAVNRLIKAPAHVLAGRYLGKATKALMPLVVRNVVGAAALMMEVLKCQANLTAISDAADLDNVNGQEQG